MDPIRNPIFAAHVVAPPEAFQDEKLRAEYQPYMVKFMNYIHGTNDYNKETVWRPEELALIKPGHIVSYFSTIVFNTNRPDEDSVAQIRVNTVAYMKKAISFFMVDKTTKWNANLSAGNPTCSKDVNDFIKYMKKKEVRRQGVASSACRPMEVREFTATIEKLNDYRNDSNPKQEIEKRFMISASLKFQFHMVARIDDTYRFLEADLKIHPEFSFALQAQFRWSKNVTDERRAPNQIILGSMDHHFCVLLGLAIYLEAWYRGNWGPTNRFLFGSGSDRDSEKNKRSVSSYLTQQMWNEDEVFQQNNEGRIGTHSVRKAPATYARRAGCQRDDIASRGRWKDSSKVVDVYIDNFLPFPDAHVASVLCIGGACCYELVEDSSITDAWLYQHVVCNMLCSPHFSQYPQVALVLALPLLWACFNDEMEAFMPVNIRSDIREAYAIIRTLPPEVSPVRRKLLYVTGDNSGLTITVVNDNAEGNGNAEGRNNAEVAGTRMMTLQANAAIEATLTQVIQLRQEVQRQFLNMGERIQHVENRLENRTEVINRNVRRIAIQPVRRHENVEPRNALNEVEIQRVQVADNATLSPGPKSLNVLWEEYQRGIDNRKLAKDFTTAEKGRCRKSYYRRKLVWTKIEIMVRAGHLSNVACDMLQAQYGQNSSVTEIINRIIAEQPRSGRRARDQVVRGRNARVRIN